MGDQVRTLEYKQAMSDFCNMFPGLDKNVIECVLRTNNGHVESTIDQLLQLTTENNETSSSRSSTTNKKDLRKLYYTLQSPSPTFEQAPPMYSAVYSSPSLQQRDHKKSPSPRHDRHHNHRYKDWNPPLLGTLPTDFLRIKERPSSSSSSRKSSSCHHRTTDMVEVGGGELDERKISCLLKNEDFLKELRNNKAFMHEVKKLMKSDLAAAAVQSNKPLEDVSFKDNLKHMSKYARSTFYDVARKFSSKKKSYKSMTSSNNNDDSNMYNDCHFN